MVVVVVVVARDGTHPSESGRDKVARLLLDFFTTDALANSWFAKPAARSAER